MKRRAALLAATALPALAQRAVLPARVVYFSLRTGPNEFEQSFLRGLAEHGWRDGDNLRIDYRFAGFDAGRAERDAQEAAKAQPDVAILADRWVGRTILRRYFPDAPVVAPAFADPIASGWTSSLARPDGGATGTAVFYVELGRKRLELLKEALPTLEHAGALYNGDRPGFVPAGMAVTTAAGAALGVKVAAIPVKLPGGAESALSLARQQGVRAVAILSDTATINYRAELCDAALSHRLPTIFSNRAYLYAGGMMSYGPDLEAVYRRAAYFTDRILRGAKPSDLPIEQITTFNLTLNLRTARAIGVQFPRQMLLRADELIE